MGEGTFAGTRGNDKVAKRSFGGSPRNAGRPPQNWK
jgi:hypothetical protein